MDVHISLAGRGDLSARIYRQLLDAVLDGRLRAGARLPPTRDLAQRLAVSRNTVALAYERLAAEGFLAGRVGAGTFVCDLPAAGGASLRQAPAGSAVHPRRLWASMPAEAFDKPLGPSPAYDFTVGVPDARLFPLVAWRRLVARELRPASLRSALYADPAGDPALRASIARFIGVSRAVRAGADDVIVTQGAQQALDLLGRVLLDPGDVVAVEAPGYPPARQLFRSLGARVVNVPVDADGLIVSALPRQARIVYVTPSHQMPLGMVMSLPRRAALLAWAERRGAVVIEDDYDSEFRFEGRPLDPLQSLDRGGRVVYVGSFSKVMLPGLRLGFLVAPASLRTALRAAKRLTDWHGELPTQGALAHFIDEGLLARHVRKAGREYAARRARIIETIECDCARWLRIVPSAAGLHVAAQVIDGAAVDVDRVVRRAALAGVGLRQIAIFCDASAETASASAAPSASTSTSALASTSASESAPRPAPRSARARRAQAPRTTADQTPLSSRPGFVIGYGAIPTAKVAEGMRRFVASLRAER